jgi:outer membrane receptor protein involved in Fe transport
VLLISAPVVGQDQGRALEGTVRDSQGGAISNATIDVVCGTAQRRVITSPMGNYVVNGLPSTACRITGASDFFEPETILVSGTAGTVPPLVLRVRTFASEIVVTPSRGIEERAFHLPGALSVTSSEDIGTRPYTVFTQVLREEPGVLLQQTTTAQTSPTIRGFTGQSNVYLVDGVRLNTASWRTGASQYTAWVDTSAINSIEVMRGGGSVQYGSDALGGTVQFLSAPLLTGLSEPQVNGSIELTGSLADSSVGGQADLGLHVGPAAVRIGANRRRAGDLRAGKGIDSHSAITRFLGLPSTLVGSRHRQTSFEQGGAYVLTDATLAPGRAVHGFLIHQAQTNAMRYDRVLGGEGLFRSGFDPQGLDLGLIRYTDTNVRVANGGVSGTFSVNRQADGRFEQSRPSTRVDRQSSTTLAIGYQLQAHHAFAPRYTLTAGTEFYNENISAERELVEPSGSRVPSRPDIPDGTTYAHLGMFVQQTADVVPNRLTVRGGARFSTFNLEMASDPVLGVIESDTTMRSVTFQAAAVTRISDALNLTANVSRAFRAPNASDLGAIGLTGGGGFEITPSRAAALNARVGSTAAAGAVSTGEFVGDLKPEVVYQYELGLKAQTRRFSASLNGFDMELFDFLQRRALVFDRDVVGTVISGFQVVRQDATGLAYIAEDVRPIATRVNHDRARVLGADAEGEVRLTSALAASGHVSIASGKLLPDGEFLRRMAPPMGTAKMRWTSQRMWAEGVVSFAAEQKRLNSADLTDARIGGVRTRASIGTFFNAGATDLGLVRNGVLVATGETLAEVQQRVLGGAASAPLYLTQPGFVTLGFRSGVRLRTGIDVTLLVENLTDTNYRLYGSGVDAPGFNVQARTRFQF